MKVVRKKTSKYFYAILENVFRVENLESIVISACSTGVPERLKYFQSKFLILKIKIELI